MRDDVGLALRQEFQDAADAAEGEFSPVEVDAVTLDLVKRYNVADEKIAELREKFMPLTIAGVEDRRGYDMVHSARMEIRDLRVTVEKTRKALKEDALEYGRKVDREAKRIASQLAPIEDHLEAQEKAVDAEREKIKAQKQAEAAALLQKRIEALQAVGHPVNLAEVTLMTEAQFGFVLESAKEAWQAKEKLRIEAEAALAKQEAERKAAEEKAAQERAAAEQAERERMEKVRAEQEAMARKLAEQKAELDRQAAEIKARQEAQERAAREEEIRQKAAADAKAKAEREAQEAAERAERERAEANARARAIEAARPDADKLRALALTIRDTALPKLTTEAGKVAMAEIENGFTRLAAFIEKKADGLAPFTPKAP